MLDVDVRAVWSQGRTIFMSWFAVTSLVGSYLFVRRSSRLSPGKSIAAGFAMTVASWLFVAAMPVSLVVYVLAQDFLLGGRPDPVSWIILLFFSALTGALSGFAVLAAFKLKVARSAFCLLLAVNLTCVGIAAYRTWAYISAHPPEA